MFRRPLLRLRSSLTPPFTRLRELLKDEITFDAEWSVLHLTRHHHQSDLPLPLSLT
ncbi:MAG: hypothetical protein P0121_11305 [Nitrospira sp.]|nr:hypothetical protein [Nitrospira sp.]